MANESDGYFRQNFAPEHLLSIGFLSALSQYTQLKFAHRPPSAQAAIGR